MPSSSSSSSSVMKILKLIVIILQALTLMITAQNPQPISHFTIQGSVFCDVCSIGAFSRHSYFLPGVNVHIECKMKANSGGNSEQIAFSVNRTTNKHGVYRVDIKTALEGIESPSESIQSFCKASLTNSSSSSSSKCSVPGLKTSTTTQLTLKSKQNNLCIYSLSPLSYTPLKKNVSLCSSNNNNKPNSFNSSKFFLPNFPPFGFVFTWPPLPSLPPLPQLPPLPSLPPWPPFLPFPFYFPPSLPPFPPSSPPYTFPTPPFRPMPFFQFPPPNPPPPGAPYNPRDPSTWIPNYPAPPQQPGYNFGNDPRTWIPYYYPPSPPQNP